MNTKEERKRKREKRIDKFLDWGMFLDLIVETLLFIPRLLIRAFD